MRLLFMQPLLAPPGGGAGVAAWMLQALREEHEITLLTWWPVDLDDVNRFWGTSLRASDFRAVRVPAPWRWLVDYAPMPLDMLRSAIMMRIARRLRPLYDLPMTADNEADFGMVGVQYVHYPWNTLPQPPDDVRWYHRKLAVAVYYRMFAAVSGFTVNGTHRNLTLVNSNWTGRLAGSRYGFVTRTVYPPVTGDFPDVPWEARQPGFVCLGRISPEKELDRLIEIVAGVRRHVPAATLHIVGTPAGRAYFRRIAARARDHGFAVHQNVSRTALADLVSHQKYGIHGMPAEHFGMAPAEMVRAGCIVWVPDGGGQVEIVDDPRLTYSSVDDAIGKIVATLRDPHEEASLRKHLAGRAAVFSVERFMREVREAVHDAARAGAR
ncbi:MAG TPA: glycosyltransferase [Methylomirabilota bacterium]|nr:glycosyltransferase [Methylomirabilota bacterium]